MKTREEIEREALLKKYARGHFWIFCNYMDYEFFQKRPFLKEPAQAIQDVHDGKINKLQISMPPRAGKSYLVTLASAFFLGNNPTGSIMRNSATATLYMKFSYDCREIIRQPRFQEIFPEAELSKDKQSVGAWNLDKAKQVSYFGAGTGGTIIGFGATLLAITDDLYKGHEEALSETINDKTHRWFESAHSSRLEKGCAQIDIGTRWHKGDVIGMRLARGDYDYTLSISALDENNETFCDDVNTTEYYHELKSITDDFIWMSEYMQKPIDAEGLVFPPSDLQYFEDKNENVGYRIAFIDTADEGEDYLSMPIVEYFAETKTGYLIDVLFNRHNLTINENLILEKINEHKLDQVVIETNKEGTYFVNQMRRKTKCPIYGQFNSTNKITRILAQSGWIMNFIKFKKNVPLGDDYQKFLSQLTTYLKTGSSKHDDAPDSISGLSRYLRSKFML